MFHSIMAAQLLDSSHRVSYYRQFSLNIVIYYFNVFITNLFAYFPQFSEECSDVIIRVDATALDKQLFKGRSISLEGRFLHLMFDGYLDGDRIKGKYSSLEG
ncbi:hypothetical protein O3M35_009275 [Rhynocoris fuscipes]|uniref:Uncharacterized protein n=1 Tax=Rhynocoris fuscipes TaxID=488301 RepID=A0AAW1D2B9_9HEMI